MLFRIFIFLLTVGFLFLTEEHITWLQNYIYKEQKENDQSSDGEKDQGKTPPPRLPPNSHPPSFFFFCERLGKDKHIEQSFRNMLKFYNDENACYVKGHARDYRGRRSSANSGKRCQPWNVIVKFLKTQMETLQEEERKAIEEHNMKNVNKKTTSNLKEYIDMTNTTIRDLRIKGLLHHNYCRDPDDTGVPWCYVMVNGDIAWEPCDIPACTVCWSIRQIGESVYGKRNGLWSPYCQMQTGDFLPLQCHLDYCWCSEKNGTIVKDSAKNTKKQGMPICDPVIKAQSKAWNFNDTTPEGANATQDFIDLLMESHISSYKKLIEIASDVFNPFDVEESKKKKKKKKQSFKLS